MQAIASEIVQNPSIYVGALIGTNCLQALEPLEIFNSEAGGPYAYKAKSQWCIVGQIGQKNDDRFFKCNKLAVKEEI